MNVFWSVDTYPMMMDSSGTMSLSISPNIKLIEETIKFFLKEHLFGDKF